MENKDLIKRKKKKKSKQNDIKIVMEETDSEEEEEEIRDIANNIVTQIRKSRDKKPNPSSSAPCYVPPSLPRS